jgi:xylulokinase
LWTAVSSSPRPWASKKNEPGLYEKTRFFLGCPEYLACALTGAARTVFPSAGFDRWFWNADILGRLDLDEAKFPPFISPGESFGTLLPAIAGRFGFARNVPVIAGGPDFYVAILGAGAVSPGRACDRSGTSEGINAGTEKRLTDRRLMSYGHPVKPFWNLSGIISTTGKALEWARNLLGLADFGEFFSLAAASPPGAGGLVFLPYLAGERAPIWDSAARGVFRGLSLSTDRAGLARSVLEGVCFAIRDVIAVMEESGARVGELRVSGAAAENGLLNQIKADITGAEILIPAHREAELLGLAIIGARALGKYASLAEAAAALVRVESRREPNPGNTVLYDELFSEYRETYRRLKGQGE